MLFSTLLRERSRIFTSLLSSRTCVRTMGGGPRTFPGGLNKWQWKRLKEKKVMVKEQGLLDEEKKLYQARLRSQISAEIAAGSDMTDLLNAGECQPGFLSPKEHIKALADQFMKEGAEDLWNEDDGPISSSLPARSPRPIGMIDKPDVDSRCSVESGGNARAVGSFNRIGLPSKLQQRRGYSASAKPRAFVKRRVWRENSSSSDDEAYVRDVSSVWPRFGAEDDNEVEVVDKAKRREAKDMRNFMSNAASGKYDVDRPFRTKRRSILNDLDKGRNYEEEEKIEEIRRSLQGRKMAAQASISEEDPDSIFSDKRFEDSDISPLTIKALTEANYVQMTRVQEAALRIYREGRDALVKARNGTGKSAAFLVPVIEEVIKAMAKGEAKRVPPIYGLILCPTRELASQISAETKCLLKYHDGLGVLMLTGGPSLKDDIKRLELDPCQIVVATPGRLLDHVESKSGFSARVMGLKVLVLDEADQLLNLGFRSEVEKIVDCVPRRKQTLCFSATIPKEVRRISQLVLKRDHVYIDTVGAANSDISPKVKQHYIVAPLEKQFPVVHEILREHIIQTPDYKVIIFTAAGMMVSLMHLLFQEMKLNVRELHSRQPELRRSRIADEFKQSKQIILISSDVPRGIHYPDVTLVIQVGIPHNRVEYIHRFGSTGLEGKDSEGVLLIAPWEQFFLDELTNLPIERAPLPHINHTMQSKMDSIVENIDTSVKEEAYKGFLGHYSSIREIAENRSELVDLADQFRQSIGLDQAPALFKTNAMQMGVKGVPGIRLRR